MKFVRDLNADMHLIQGLSINLKYRSFCTGSGKSSPKQLLTNGTSSIVEAAMSPEPFDHVLASFCNIKMDLV